MEQPSFDAAYLSRLFQQDPETERHFVGHFTTVLQARLRFRLRSAQLVDDICQETLLRVFQQIRAGTAIERLPAFVHGVSKNVMLEALRGQKRHGAGAEEIPDMPDLRVDFDSGLVTEGQQSVIRAVMNELPEKDRVILRRIFLEEADREEVCQELSVDGEYLRVLLHRAKNRFRSVLEKTRQAGERLLSFFL